MRIIILFIIILNFTLSAQNNKIDLIKNSNQFYWGEAYSDNDKAAEDFALAKLLEQIAFNVSSSFETSKIETEKGIDETVEKIVKTYAGATLTNTKTIKDRIDDRIYAFRYIEKSEVKKVFDERKELIGNIFEEALEFEKYQNYGYALKSYYFAIILMNSIPAQSIKNSKYNLTVEIPNRITRIIKNTSFVLIDSKTISNTEKVLKFNVTVLDKPANYLEFSFWDGSNMVDVEVKDGKGVCSLFGSSIAFDDLDVYIKYKYYNCRKEIKQVAELWDLVIKPSFDNDQKVELEIDENLKEKAIEKIEKDRVLLPIEGNFVLKLANKENCDKLNEIGTETVNILELLKSGNNYSLERYFADDIYLQNKFKSIVKYNSPKVLYDTIYADINKTFSGWELRKIEVLNEYSSIKKQVAEYIVLDFDKEGKILDVSFGIMDNLYDTFVRQAKYYGKDWDNRQVILKFIEKYRTAFLTRDLEVLNSIFSDEAVIIVGRILQKKRMKDSYKYSQLSNTQPDFEYIRQTKNEYLKKQKELFAFRKDIFLGYSTFKIHRKNDQPDVYGISMRQNYHSSDYADEGYLFLLVDFNEALPQIYVRSWQPQEWDKN